MNPNDSKFVKIFMLAQILAPIGILGTMVICLKRKDFVCLNVPL